MESTDFFRSVVPLLLVAAWSVPAEAEAQSPRVALTVNDELGAARNGEVVCSGVPFAKGSLRPSQPMHMVTDTGQPLPTQTKVLGHWPDGSVKWLLVQFVADCPANGRRGYTLAPGTGPLPTHPVAVRPDNDQILVTTGRLRVSMLRSRLTFLDEVLLHCDEVDTRMLSGGTPMRFVLTDGTLHSSANTKPDLVEVEESGPIRATIRMVGWLQGPKGERLYKLDTRLRFYAGQAYVKAEYTFVCLGKPELHEVREIAVDLAPPSGTDTRYLLPGDTIHNEGTLSTKQTAVLSVDSKLVCKAGLAGSQSTARTRLDGWALLRNENAAVGVAIRDFRHLCPKAIELAPTRITLSLWSPRGGEILRLGRTRAKTHHVLYDFGAVGGRDAALDRLRAFQQPLIATPDPEYFCATGALGPLSPEGAPETTDYDKKVAAAFETLRQRRETWGRENGLLHYGDWYHGGYGNKLTRGDLEYDTGHACFLLYARSGRRAYYDFAVACNQHFIDIDVNHETGDQRYHGYGDHAETHEAVTTGMEWGHVFTDCPADAYCLTGDERSLAAVRMIADRVATIADGDGYGRIRDILAGAERQLGWPLLALCRAYEVTRDEKYLKAAAKVVAYIKIYAKDPPAQYADGKWWRSWMMDGAKVFMTGIVHDGLAAYYELTKDPELRDVIIKSLNWLIDHMWNPQTDTFVYEFNAMNRPHRMVGTADLNMEIVDAFRFGYELTGDRRYWAVAARAFRQRVREMKPEVDGKSFSIDTRRSPYTAAYFAREHIAPNALPPPPQPLVQAPTAAPEGPRPEVLLRADFDGDLKCHTQDGERSGDRVGRIDFVPGRRGQAVAVGRGGYAWLPAPPDLLRRPGSIELWVRLHFKKKAEEPGQSAVFSIEGSTPLIDALEACTIYGDLRIRMKDHVGHLHGTAEGLIAQWEPGEWHHVTVTWDNQRVRLYLDGKEQTRPDEGKRAGDAGVALPSGPQTRINLGWRLGNWHCDCDIDQLTVYGRALTEAEVAARLGS